MDDTPRRLRFDEFELDEANASLTRVGKPVPLPPKSFAVLCELSRQPGQLTRKGALLDAVWGHRHVSESVLKTTVSQLRAALADDAAQPRYIETVSRHGYRFIAKLVDAATSTAALRQPTRPPGGTVIGRQVPLASLHDLWDRVRGGESRMAWIAGEAGVGKTTLITQFLEQAAAPMTLVGHCVEHLGTSESCLPILEVLRQLCQRDPSLPDTMRAVAPTWIVQMPWLIAESDRLALHRELAGAHPDRMARELRELLGRIAASQPMILVTEDLHWSDPGTLRMLEHFARQSRGIPMLWIASFRLTQIIAEDHPLAGLRHELRMHGLCDELLLDPFSEDEVSAYLRMRVPETSIHEDFVRRIHHHTEGLPLFVANVTDNLLSQAEIDPASGARLMKADSAAPLPVPESLGGVIEKQIRRLPTDAQDLLTAASICGVEFRASVLSSLVGRELAWVRDTCDELARRQFWLQHVGISELPNGEFDARYAFQHALYQWVFYNRLPASQRVRLHRLVARELASARGGKEEVAAAELASHYERGHETLPALRAYADAAQAALGRFDPQVAQKLAAHGLALLGRLPDDPERNSVEFELVRPAGVAASLIHGVGSQQARVPFERVRELCELLPATPERAVALNGMGWLHYVRGEYVEALDLARRLEDSATRHDDAVLRLFACNLAGVALIARGELQAGCAALEQGIRLCTQLGDRVPLTAFVIDPEVSMRMNVAFPLVDRGLADQGREHLRIGMARAERIQQPMALMLSNWCGGMLGIRIDDVDLVAAHARGLSVVLSRTMLTQGHGPELWLRGWVEAMRGDTAAGHAHVMEGYQSHARLGMYSGCAEVLGYAAEALITAGDWTAAAGCLEDALELSHRIGERLALPRLLLMKARVASGRKDLAGARGALHECLAEARAQAAHGAALHALVALVELKGSKASDAGELRRALDAMKEGADLPIYRRASDLLSRRA